MLLLSTLLKSRVLGRRPVSLRLLCITILFGFNCASNFGQTLTVVNSATYAGVPADATGFPYVAPGSLVSMFGANIAPGATFGSDAAPAPLPTRLAGVSATITDASGNSRPIGLVAVTPGQVNAVLPSDLQE